MRDIKLTSLGQNIDIHSCAGKIHIEMVRDGVVINLPERAETVSGFVVTAANFILQSDPELFDWVTNASDEKRGAGSFVRFLAQAAQVADYENYPELVPVLRKMKEKYPQYCEPSYRLDVDAEHQI